MTFDAALAAALEVVSFEFLLWVSALAAAALEALPVEGLFKVFEAAAAAFLPVPFAIMNPPKDAEDIKP